MFHASALLSCVMYNDGKLEGLIEVGVEVGSMEGKVEFVRKIYIGIPYDYTFVKQGITKAVVECHVCDIH